MKCFISFFFFLIYLFIYLFIIYFWLRWVFISVRGLSLVVASGGHPSSLCAGLPPSRPLLLRSTGSKRAGSVVVAHGPSRSAACGILPDQVSNPRPLHWQADSQPLRHQGSPKCFISLKNFSGVIWTAVAFFSSYDLGYTVNIFSMLGKLLSSSLSLDNSSAWQQGMWLPRSFQNLRVCDIKDRTEWRKTWRLTLYWWLATGL